MMEWWSSTYLWLDLQKLAIMSHLANCIFIGPANNHTRTLPMHCCIYGLSWLVWFSGAGFVDHVKSWLRQWSPWRALDGRYGSDIHPCVSEVSLEALQVCLGLVVLGLIAIPNSCIRGYNAPPTSHLLPPPTPPPSTCPPPYMCNLWYYSGCEILQC